MIHDRHPANEDSFSINKRTLATAIRRWPLPLRLSQIVWRRVVQPWVTAGAIGAVHDGAGRFLIVEHVFHPNYPWGLPGGWMNRHEDPATTVQREVREETGLIVTIERPLLITVPARMRNHLDIAYLCRAQPGTIVLSAELLDYRWITLSEAPPMSVFHRAVLEEVSGANT